jgi:preprotein translocase subunit YajC
MGPLIVILVVVAVAWFLFGVPARRRSRAHAAMQDAVDVGDEIITAGGLHAIVREVGEGELRVEIAPNVVATLDRRAVAAVAQEEPAQEEHEAELTSAAPTEIPPEAS